MKKTILYLLALCIFSLTMVSCDNADEFTVDEDQENFIETSTINGAYNTSKTILGYDQSLTQQGVRTGDSYGYQYKLQYDSQDIYFVVKMDSAPSAVDETLSVTIKSKSLIALSSQTVKMTVAKLTSTQAWLWSSTEKIGFIVPLSL